MIIKDTFREIKSTYKRFISLLLIAFLGVGFFVGIRSTSPDMEISLNNYYDENNVYDIKIISTAGLDQKDLLALKKIKQVAGAYGTYSFDTLVYDQDVELVTKVTAINDQVNKINLVKGRLPKNNKECVIDAIMINTQNLKIGEQITIDSPYVVNKKQTIVGFVNSSLYISNVRGTTKLGSGKIDYLIYIPEDNIKLDYYTEIYLTINNQSATRSKSYLADIKKITKDIKEIKVTREQARYDQIIEEATTTINKAETKLNNAQEKANRQFNYYQKQINQNQQTIVNSQKELALNQQLLAEKLNQQQIFFADAENQLALSYEQYNLELAKLAITEAELELTLNNLKNSLPSITDPIIYAATSDQIILIEGLITTGQTLATQQNTLATEKVNALAAITAAQEQLASSEEQLTIAASQLAAKQQDLNEQRRVAKKEFKINQAKIVASKNELLEIEKPEWYVLDRKANVGYLGFTQDIDSLTKIGLVFPLLFFIIAILVSLTSMTRMVEEQRVQIGTLKALGYNNVVIATKYLIYASLATVIGGSIGMVVGSRLLPNIIWSMYKLMYTIPHFILDFNELYGYLGLTMIWLGIVGATIYACYQELKVMPAIIMRPKPPKSGKKVLLEKIPFIWQHLNFTNKVTIRNIFRYKKRFLMTIIGISGCTALIVTGFGIRDAVANLLNDQYQKILKYDMAVNIKNDASANDKKELLATISKNKATYAEIDIFSGKLLNPKEDQEVQIIVAEDYQQLRKMINLPNNAPQEGIYITEKVAALVDARINHEVTLATDDNKDQTLVVKGIVENYLNHYLYMTKAYYEEQFGKYKVNQILVKYDNLNEKKFNNELLKNKAVSAISQVSTFRDYMNNTLKSLKYIVGVLIVSSGILAFVVLYNLSTVNISERKRELATIKVLGFYDKEVHQYLSKETKLLTVIGIALGLLSGYYLNKYIVRTCEINIIRFNGHIEWYSFIYAILITAFFTFVVSVVNNFVLKKIDMIESLKSIE